MIKINLLPGYILESRRVKKYIVCFVLLLAIEVAVLSGYIWAPAPFSLTSQQKRADDRLTESTRRHAEVTQLQQDVDNTKARFAAKGGWVAWVNDADKIPDRWATYLKLVNKYIPNDVVINGLPLPSGTTLQLTGSTSDLRAASRWYLNMLRSEIVDPSPNAVTFQVATAGWPGALTIGGIDKMAMPVSMTVQLNPAYVPVGLAPAIPPDAGVGGGGAMGGPTGGPMGGRMGRMGGGGMGRGATGG